MRKYRIELDDGTGTLVELDVEADDQNTAEDLAVEKVRARPGADAELVIIITTTPL